MPPLEALWDAFAAGVYVLFGLIHVDLWRRRRERQGHLWLAGASASALGVDLSGLAMRHLPPPVPPALVALNLLGVTGATVCLYELATFLGDRRSGRRAQALQVVLAGLALAAAVPALRGLSAGVLGLAAGFLVAALARAVQAAGSRHGGVATVARGFLFLIACLLADVAMELGLVPVLQGLPALGFIVLFLASARSLADRQDREHLELVQLRGDLERRVEERTLALQEANQRLAEVSRTDDLTGLANRRAFLAACEAELLRARRSGRPFSIVLGDVDHFKRVNDTWGHAVGDGVLRAVAEAVRGALRQQDLVARWGGEELILLLCETGATGAGRAAETVRAAVEALRVEAGGASIGVTLSLGVAEHDVGSSLDVTIGEADRALYRAKQAGRNRVAAAD